MAAARFWRIVGLATQGGTHLSLSELQLCSASQRADVAATLTCTHAPVAGSLAALRDGNASGVCTWTWQQVAQSSFALLWDFGSATGIDGVLIGGGADQASYAATFQLQSSSDGVVWSAAALYERPSWPGAMSLGGVRAPGGTTSGWNPDAKHSSITLSEDAKTASGVAFGSVRGFPSSGSVPLQFEVKTTAGGASSFMIGLATASSNLSMYPGYDNQAWCYYAYNGTKYFGNSGQAYGDAYGVNDIIGVVLGSDSMSFYKNGVPLGVAFTGLAGKVLMPVAGWGSGGNAWAVEINDGLSPFAFPVAGANPWATLAVGLDSPLKQLSQQIGAKTAWADAVPAHTVNRLGLQGAANAGYGGRGRVQGTVMIKGTPNNAPVRRRVRLLRDRDAICVGETWSDPITGAYAFTNLDERERYTAVAYDHTRNFRAVIADNLPAEVLA